MQHSGNGKYAKQALTYADAIISTLREPFLVLDGALRVISSNRSFYRNFKVKKQETIGRSLFDLGDGQWNIPRLLHLLKEILRQKTVVTDYEVAHDFEHIGYRIMNLNARRLHAPKEIVSSMTEETGEKEYILLAIEDITEHRRIEQQVQEAKVRGDAILASIGDAVMACDADGRVTLFNRVAETLTGFAAKEVIGRPYGAFMRFIREKDEKPSNDFIAQAIETGRKTAMANHMLLVRKDGSTIPVADSAAPINDVSGVLMGCVVVFRDVTWERGIDKEKTEFVSLAAHQLKTPPTAIKWLTETLLEDTTGPLTGKQKDHLNSIYTKNEQMINVVNALLDVSRIELGIFAITPTPVDINLLVHGILDDLALRIRAKHLQVREMYTKKKIIIAADANLLRMVMQNLLTNAITYTLEGGHITVEVSVRRKGERVGERIMSADSVVCMVADTGCGIPKEQQDKIFTKLFRADNARELSSDGAGLGLYIVKSIVDSFGGAVWFDSEEQQGTIFYVTIPRSGMKARAGGKQLVSSA